jgi:carboxyl-terminal processing protease
MNNKKIQTLLPLYFSIAVIIGMFVGYKLHSNMPTAKSFFNVSGKNKMEEVIELIKQRYVDPVNIDSISEIGIVNVLETLDPHSVYIPTVSIKEMNEDLEGKFEGIGVEFNIFNDTVHVLAVLPNGPSFKAGLKVGDKILFVNDSVAIGLKETDKFKSWVKGPGGTEVNLKIEREKKILTKTVVRGTIPVTSIDASYMIDSEKGYIRLNRFSGSTYEEFMKELEDLKAKGMQRLVLDLRDNGGGILDEAVDIADEFIGDNEMIVYTEGKSNPRKDYYSKRPGMFEKGNLIILMNEGSASASEVLAGALQDLDRATVVGRRSFGKGLVQEQYTLSDGSALRLTTARYYTPLGRSIQKSYENGNEEYKKEVINRFHNQEDQKTDTSKASQLKTYKTAAGKKLYGGGGIWPDVFVGLDTTYFDTTINKFYLKNTVGNFAYKFYINNRSLLQKYKNANEFINGYQFPANFFESLIQFAKKDSIQITNINTPSRDFLQTRIKALVARIIWGETGYYQVLNSEDALYKTGVGQLK